MATTWAGVKPMLFSTPIRRKPATTAPLATLTTISTDSTRPMMPNATTNGTIGAMPVSTCCRTARYDCVATMAPRGSDLASVRTSARGATGSGGGEPVQQLRARRVVRRAQRRDLGRQHPAVRGLADGVGDADEGQHRGPGHAVGGDVRADRQAKARVAGQHELVGSLRPAAANESQVIDRPAGRGPADERDRRRAVVPARATANDRIDRHLAERTGQRRDAGQSSGRC